MPRLWWIVVAAMLALAAPALRAQAPAGEADFPRQLAPDAAESARLRALATEPLPDSLTGAALSRRLADRVDAAFRLSERVLIRQVLTDAMARDPKSARWPAELANAAFDDGDAKEGERLLQQAIALSSRPAPRLFFEAWLADRTLLRQDDALAGTEVERLRGQAEALLAEPALSTDDRLLALRVLARSGALRASLQSRRGRHADSLASLRGAEGHLQRALALAQNAGFTAGARFIAIQAAVVQRSIVYRLLDLDRFAEAGEAIEPHQRFVLAHRLPADWGIGIAVVRSEWRFAQRDFAGTETHLRQSLALRDGFEREAMTVHRINDVGMLCASLWAQGRAAEAWRELALLDARVRPLSQALRNRARLAYTRGLVLLDTGRAREAVPLFRELAKDNARQWGEGHYWHAQAEGLVGVALWRTGDAALRDEALDVLRRASTRLMAPGHVQVQMDRGIRPRVRELILATHVEAATTQGGLPALLALGVADGLRPGITAQALAAAALRGASGDAELGTLVREDQDAQRELQAIQDALAAAGTGTEPPSPQVAEGLRRRLLELDQQRAQLRQQLRARYPAYEQLASPAPADTTAVAQQLARDEVLVFLLPTERAVLAWSISANELPQFRRIELGLPELQALVGRVRQSVTFGNGTLPRYDHEAARQLYLRLLAPLAAGWGRAQQLIIATSGPLGSLPFAALVTEGAADASGPPWLIRRWSVSQVPGVAAWLALRALPAARPAPEPLIGWGDPAFALAGAARAKGAAVRSTTLRYGDLPPLPESRDELRGIAAALKADAERDLLLGAAATRASVLEASRSGTLAKKRVVVFATHGLTGGELQGLDQPALALAATTGGNTPLAALLTLEDVLTLKLNAEWVVLSACNTAAPNARGDEALSGLARGFLYAGSRTLLATQWEVETESVKRLTTATFEQRAQRPGMAKAEALRQAMLGLAATPRYAHPAYWAPFVLVGDGRP